MKDSSIWSNTVNFKKFPTLDKNIKTKILVVGGGITGILCAYELKKRNIDCILVERDTIGKGISKNTTAFITAQHELLYQDIIKKHGIKNAKKYLRLNLRALHEYRKLGDTFDIDFQNCSSIMFSSESKSTILKEKIALDKLGYKTEFVNELPLENIDIKLGIKFNRQGKLNPLKLINVLSNDLEIYEHTRVENIKRNKAYANNHIIEFDKVIIASHYPLIDKTGLYFLKLFQRRSYVVALKHRSFSDTYCSVDEDGMYFRSYHNYLIIGGNDRNVGRECKCSFVDKIKKLYKYENIDYYWSNQDLITIDQIPYIGKYDIFHKNWYVATGFDLWGFTWAMVSSFVLADMIEGKKGIKLLSPQRFWIKKQLFVNIGNTLKNMLTFRRPRCTHLGVALKYNKVDNTYECPAHGSRFDKDGKVLNGPAKRNSDSTIFNDESVLGNARKTKRI